MWLNLDVRLEDVWRLKIGDAVQFTLDDGNDVTGNITWLSSRADERSRMVQVRAELSNDSGSLLAHAFGKGRIVLRSDDQAIVVPGESVQWEGDCHIVFVRDRNFNREGAPRCFMSARLSPAHRAAQRRRSSWDCCRVKWSSPAAAARFGPSCCAATSERVEPTITNGPVGPDAKAGSSRI